jgi:hypothetical protein
MIHHSDFCRLYLIFGSFAMITLTAFLDLLQVYRPVSGSSGMFEFQARFPLPGKEESPLITARRLPCRCASCRAVMLGADPLEHICVILEGSGLFSSHCVAHVETFSLSETTEKKSRDKSERQRKTAEKIAALAAAAAAQRDRPELAPNPAAASEADQVSPENRGAAEENPLANVIFVQILGALDAGAAAAERGDTEFQYQALAHFDHDSTE